MPLIQVSIMEGRSEEKIEKLIHELTKTTAETLGSPIENVRVLVNEMPTTHWGIAGESVAKKKSKEAN
ncbi:4-oxalocrotonate tautomerase [Geomicrobium sp. JCM 19039]|uniref:4-oxalocrotonate tautomerase n=1 Tax=Geomicrobium sp. JCM 19039 TaxID=1460636 RepID=UPI00045F2C78|nr:4-oxalocrotonate tautomerase [Geomicrobium sp. JCM 19039]GAK14249.1 small molecule metabolism [Geomicrobium sp. JCM 19039]